jgi:hypothetical protein
VRIKRKGKLGMRCGKGDDRSPDNDSTASVKKEARV